MCASNFLLNYKIDLPDLNFSNAKTFAKILDQFKILMLNCSKTFVVLRLLVCFSMTANDLLNTVFVFDDH